MSLFDSLSIIASGKRVQKVLLAFENVSITRIAERRDVVFLYPSRSRRITSRFEVGCDTSRRLKLVSRLLYGFWPCILT